MTSEHLVLFPLIHLVNHHIYGFRRLMFQSRTLTSLQLACLNVLSLASFQGALRNITSQGFVLHVTLKQTDSLHILSSLSIAELPEETRSQQI